jgi:hypothetical protein
MVLSISPDRLPWDCPAVSLVCSASFVVGVFQILLASKYFDNGLGAFMAAMMSKGDTSGFGWRSLSLGFSLGFVTR